MLLGFISHVGSLLSDTPLDRRGYGAGDKGVGAEPHCDRQAARHRPGERLAGSGGVACALDPDLINYSWAWGSQACVLRAWPTAYAAALTSIFFSALMASGFLGSLTVRIPFLKLAPILSVSTPSGTAKRRSKEPKRRSWRW